jgi:hypothetical protein
MAAPFESALIERVLDMWHAGFKTRVIMKVVAIEFDRNIQFGTVQNLALKARKAGDPRATNRRPELADHSLKP